MGRHLFNRSGGAALSSQHRRWSVATGAAAVAGLVAVAGAGACGDANGSTTTDPTTTVASTSTTLPPLTALVDADTSPVSVPAPSGAEEPARLVGVRVSGQDGYDRVVFELEGDLPGYDIGYLDGPLYEDGSGDVVEVVGGEVLSVRMTPASGVAVTADGVEEFYNGERRITGDGEPVLEVVRAGDFEAQLTWGIVVDAQRPFQVSRLEAPNRLVVDVANL